MRGAELAAEQPQTPPAEQAEPEASAPACEVDENDKLGRHLICGGRAACAFTGAAEVDPARELPEFYVTDDKAERHWLVEFEQLNPTAGPDRTEAVLRDYRRTRAIAARDTAERRARTSHALTEAGRCPICRRENQIGNTLVSTGGAGGRKGSARVEVVGRDHRGAPVLQRLDRSVEPEERRSPFELPTFRRDPDDTLRLPGRFGIAGRLVTACSDCRLLVLDELTRALAGVELEDGETLGQRCAAYVREMYPIEAATQ